MTKATDPLAAALRSAGGMTGKFGKIQFYFGDRPEVLTAILDADKRGVQQSEIARLLSRFAPEGVAIQAGSVKTWLDANRPKTH
jgi:hypothetical protein